MRPAGSSRFRGTVLQRPENKRVKGILVTELNAGQMIEDVRLAVNGKVKVEHFGRLGGIVPDPDEIVEALAKLKIEG